MSARKVPPPGREAEWRHDAEMRARTDFCPVDGCGLTKAVTAPVCWVHRQEPT